MESIKEEELNLQREVVTTTPNTWLVEAVNPTTGEKKMINVSNFASVVAGVMGRPMGYKNAITPSDYDNIIQSGYYPVRGTSSNSVVEDYGTLIVYESFSDNIVQVKYSLNIFGGVVKRVKLASGWTPWQRIDNFGYNTLADLAGGMGIGLRTGYTIAPGNEVDLGVSDDGVYVLTNSDSGNTAMYLVSAYPEGVLTEASGLGSGVRFSNSLTEEGLICFGRKATNGNLFIVNNRTSDVKVSVRYYT